MGSAESRHRLAAEIIAFKKCADNARRLPMPDGIADKDGVIGRCIDRFTGDGGARRRIILFLIAASAGVIGQICFRIGLLGQNLIQVGIENVGDLFSHGPGSTSGREEHDHHM